MTLSLKKNSFNAIFIIKPTNPGWLKKQIWVEKPQGQPWSHAAKRLL